MVLRILAEAPLDLTAVASDLVAFAIGAGVVAVSFFTTYYALRVIIRSFKDVGGNDYDDPSHPDREAIRNRYK